MDKRTEELLEKVLFYLAKLARRDPGRGRSRPDPRAEELYCEVAEHLEGHHPEDN